MRHNSILSFYLAKICWLRYANTCRNDVLVCHTNSVRCSRISLPCELIWVSGSMSDPLCVLPPFPPKTLSCVGHPLFCVFVWFCFVGVFLVPPPDVTDSQEVHSCDQLITCCIPTLVLQAWVVSPFCLFPRVLYSSCPRVQATGVTLWSAWAGVGPRALHFLLVQIKDDVTRYWLLWSVFGS